MAAESRAGLAKRRPMLISAATVRLTSQLRVGVVTGEVGWLEPSEKAKNGVKLRCMPLIVDVDKGGRQDYKSMRCYSRR